MKKYSLISLLALALPLLCIGLISFSPKGGDVFEIYLNGRQVHRQFVHADNNVKLLRLVTVDEADKIEVVYSHCGASGKNRRLMLQNENNSLVKEWTFTDVNAGEAKMFFYRRDIAKNRGTHFNLYYASKELPSGKLLAKIQWMKPNVTAKH